MQNRYNANYELSPRRTRVFASASSSAKNHIYEPEGDSTNPRANIINRNKRNQSPRRM